MQTAIRCGVCAKLSLAILAGASPAWVMPNQRPSTDPAREAVTLGVKPGVGRWRAIAQAKGLSPEIRIVVAGRTATLQVGNSAVAVLVRPPRRTGVEDHRRPSHGIVRNLGDPAASVGVVAGRKRRAERAAMRCRESDQLIVAA